ncbi:phosphotransferase [Tardiphaga sp. vice304]|uniref:phosphotransferase n=1 Tax=Tardiphaga sp. vice304 TaxID=2592817 RepID=UPI00116533FE|nr:phosphotransferase [Tardiphaga sp. vice304]QDM26495.1 phosphotransferase [Tardiphaga sp. vice304]
MTSDPFNIVPATHRDTARSALAAAFGSAPIGAIAPLMGGVSGALVFRVTSAGRQYVLRMEGAASPLRNPHQYASMQIAAEAGIAPRLHFVDDVSRVVVMDFIAEQPLLTFPGGQRALAHALGEMLRRLQATPTFEHFVEYPDIVTRLWAHVCRTGLFAPGVLDAHTQRLTDIRAAYVWNPADAVSAHNDVLPRNLLFDGEQLWLVDWESAYCSDPLIDVGIALDNFAPSPELEDVLLQAWLGRAPDRAMRDRLALTRALTRLYYAGVQFSAVAAGPRPAPDTDVAAPTLAEFRRALRDGRLSPDAAETRQVLGKMYLAAFFTGGKPPGLPPPISAFRIKHDLE